MEDTTPTHKPEFGRAAARLALAVLLAGLAAFVWRHHFVKPYSDPLNWLEFAADFRRQFTQSKWPFGYPLFLKGMLALLGPVWVFLSNLPLLLLLGALLARLTAAVFPGDPSRARLAGVAAACFWVATNPDLLVQLTNPYRDPLSHVLMLCGMLCLLRHADHPGASPGWMLLSGWCIGYAYCVRETTVVLLPVLFLAGLLGWARDRRRPLWKPVLLFALGLGLGALPFLIQGQLATGQLLKPVQSQKSGTLVPGMRLDRVHELLPHAIAQYRVKFTLAGWAVIAAGLALLVRRRAWMAVALTAGAAVSYFVFYSFYYTHVPRYFFITDLFFAALFGAGAAALAAALRLAGRGLPAAAAVLVGLTLLHLARVPASRIPPFRVADARAFSAALRAHVPEGALVLADRNLCEVVRWLHPVESFAVEGLADGAPMVSPGFAAAGLERRIRSGQPVYVARIRAPGASDLNRVAAQETHDLEPVWSFRASEFGLSRILPRAQVDLMRVTPWRRTVTEHTLASPGAGWIGLRLSARRLWATPGRTFARLSLNGRVLLERVGDGQNVVGLPPDLPVDRPWTLRLESDAPVPADLDPRWVREDDAVSLELGIDADPEDAPLLGEGLRGLAVDRIHLPVNLRGFRTFTTNGVVRVPSWWGSNRWAFAFAEAKAVYPMDIPPARLVLTSAAGRDERPFPYGAGRQVRAVVPLPPASETPSWFELSFRLEDVPPALYPDVDSGMVCLDRVVLQTLPRREVFAEEIGRPRALPFRHRGFFDPEDHAGGKVVWSGPEAEFQLWLKPAGRPLRLLLSGFDRRPPRAPPAAPRLTLAGLPLEARFDLAADGRFTLTALLPAERLVEGGNALAVTVAGWKPRDYAPSKDQRELGLLWDRLAVEADGP